MVDYQREAMKTFSVVYTQFHCQIIQPFILYQNDPVLTVTFQHRLIKGEKRTRNNERSIEKIYLDKERFRMQNRKLAATSNHIASSIFIHGVDGEFRGPYQRRHYWIHTN